MTEQERFWAKVNKNGPLNYALNSRCWEWTAGKRKEGYGHFQLGRGRYIRSHRYSYILANGSIPDRALVIHRCDNPPCVNPAHLRVGTAADNTRDKMERGRHRCGTALKTHCIRGHELQAVPGKRKRPCKICRKLTDARFHLKQKLDRRASMKEHPE